MNLKVISCVYNLWPNDYSQPLDISLIHSYNRALPIVHLVGEGKILFKFSDVEYRTRCFQTKCPIDFLSFLCLFPGQQLTADSWDKHWIVHCRLERQREWGLLLLANQAFKYGSQIGADILFVICFGGELPEEIYIQDILQSSSPPWKYIYLRYPPVLPEKKYS